MLARPHRVTPLLDAIEATTPGARVVFLSDAYDRPEHEAITRELGRDGVRIELDTSGGSYAAKINAGVELTDEPLIFTGADDLDPQANWFEAAQAAMVHGAQVVGVNDLIERRRNHATHFLLTREYAEKPAIDGSRGPFFEGYHHWYCDDELLATARKRGVYAYAPDAEVLHLHPMAGRAEDDATYARGRERMREDRRLHNERAALWT